MSNGLRLAGMVFVVVLTAGFGGSMDHGEFGMAGLCLLFAVWWPWLLLQCLKGGDRE